MIDEAKRWKEILERTVTIQAAHKGGPVTMTMQELLEWLETERGFLRREAAAAFLTQYQRATVHRDEARKQFAKNHYCGMNCATCGTFKCNACDNCPELFRGGFCDDNCEVCDRTPTDIVAYAEALADWVCEFRGKRAER